jgi:hypothetical protein
LQVKTFGNGAIKARSCWGPKKPVPKVDVPPPMDRFLDTQIDGHHSENHAVASCLMGVGAGMTTRLAGATRSARDAAPDAACGFPGPGKTEAAIAARLGRVGAKGLALGLQDHRRGDRGLLGASRQPVLAPADLGAGRVAAPGQGFTG